VIGKINNGNSDESAGDRERSYTYATPLTNTHAEKEKKRERERTFSSSFASFCMLYINKFIIINDKDDYYIE